MSLLVFGHRNPDTDAPPNQRTEFVLKRAGIAPPRIVMDVRPQLEDICRRNPPTACLGESFHDAYQRMKDGDLRAIPVVDSHRRVVGVLSVLNLMDLFFRDAADATRARTVETSLQTMCDVVGGSFQHVLAPEQRDELLVMVGAMSAEGFTERMESYPARRLVVVCGDRPTIHLPAIEHGVRALVITG